MTWKNIFCGCGMWVGAATLVFHVRSPRHSAWALTQRRHVQPDKAAPLPSGPPSWRQKTRGAA